MSEFSERIAKLSPEARAVLERRLMEKSSPDAALTIQLRGGDGPAPLSFAQQRLWVLDRLEPGKPFFNIPLAFRIRGRLDVSALERALNTIRERHHVLRSVFLLVDGEPVQTVACPESGAAAFQIIDLSALEGSQEAEAVRLADEEAQKPFDLSRGPLLRTVLLRLAEEEHVLLLTVHHIVFDGWSGDIFYEELAALYEAFHEGRSSPLSPPRIQYADFAVWQREWLRGQILEEQLSYWKQQLKDAPALFELPGSHPRPPAQTFRGATESRLIARDVADAIRVVGQREKATLFMTLLAAFQVLLQRYSGRNDILVGSPVAGRNRSDIEGLIGFFVNTLVLRTDLSGDLTFRELLRRVREVTIGAFDHQDIPFEKLVEELNPERTLSHPPLFQIMMILQNASRASLRLGDLKVRPLRVGSGTANYDLTLSFTEKKGTLNASLQYNTDLFEAETARRMLEHLNVLLSGIVEDPDRRLSGLPMMTAEERHRVLVEWNQTETEYPKDKTVNRLFEEQVQRTPEAVAVEFEGKRLTYGELNRRSNQLARYLRSMGVGPEVLVGLCVERSLEMVVALFGILKAGGAYVPLDPRYPEERLAFMLEDSKPPVLISERALAKKFSLRGLRILLIDKDWSKFGREDAEDFDAGTLPENPAYVIYTSGSSGKPKGVSVPHRGVVNFLVSMSDQPGISSRDKLLAVTTLSFDIAGLEIYLPLIAGAEIVLVGRDVASSGMRLLEVLKESGATIMQATPATWRLLLEAGWQGRSPLKILCGGEALPRDLASYLLARGSTVWNLYGPTETTIWSTLYQVGQQNGPVPIGRPIANTRIYLLDGNGQPVPVGLPGEIHIGGVGVARGYLHRSELTEEKFIPDLFCSEPEARLYRTGDLGRYLSDGNIEYLGRLDHQVKVRGFRVEPGEIEVALRAHPAIREAAVVLRGVEENQRLVAYLVSNPEEAPRPSEIRAYLKKKLPDPMIPSTFVMLDSLPLTPSGKVDRKALPSLDHLRPELERKYIAPRDALELQLTQIWEKVLDVEPIGMRDDFFDLGGHSLLAVRLFSQIEKAFDRHLPLAAIFQAPTVEQFATLLRQEGWTPSWSSLVPIQPGGARPPFYCVHALGGNVLTYMDLARHLGLDQPVYGLQARGLDGKELPHTRVEDMAAHYIKEIRKLQPVGPYYMGGTSAGGMVAFEMAQQLNTQGEEVAVLALFDTWGPDYPAKFVEMTALRRRITRFIERVDLHMGNLVAAEGLREKIAYFVTKSARLRKRLAIYGIGYWETLRELPREIVEPLPPTLQKVESTSRKASDRYVPKPYSGRITLFRATKQPAGFNPDPELGWTRFALGGVEVYEVPGYHGAIVYEPRIGILARQLGECLEKAHSARQTRFIPHLQPRLADPVQVLS